MKINAVGFYRPISQQTCSSFLIKNVLDVFYTVVIRFNAEGKTPKQVEC